MIIGKVDTRYLIIFPELDEETTAYAVQEIIEALYLEANLRSKGFELRDDTNEWDL
jgi:hypothetical protein